MTRLGLGLALLVLLGDQASKYWVLNRLDLPALGSVALLPVLNLTMVWNHGVTFGLMAGLGGAGPWLLTAVAIGIVLLLGVWMRRTERPAVAAARGAGAGGAVQRWTRRRTRSRRGCGTAAPFRARGRVRGPQTR